MISREDVVYAYRLLLGREPENEGVITHYATEVADLRALRSLFINSTEFQTTMASVLAPRSPRLPFNGPAMVVELDAPPKQFEALFAKVSQQWHHLGETEPHWSVLTNDSYFQETFHMNRAAFYASGESEITMFAATLARAGLALQRGGRCLELGCGVGRVTAPLARRYAQVAAVDISSAHLRVAQAHLEQENLSNVQCLHLESLEGVAALGRFDCLYSRIVLQHNPPPVMQRLLVDLLGQLNPGGVAYVQIPTYKAGYSFSVEHYLGVDNRTDMEMHFFPQAALLDLFAEQGCQVLEIREDDAIGLSLTTVSNTVLLQKR